MFALLTNSRPRGKKATFVIDRYTKMEWDLIKRADLELFQYVCAGQEVGHVDGIPHIQGYCVFHTAQTFKKIAESQPGFSRARFKFADGSSEKNRDYCHKGPICKSEDVKMYGRNALDYGLDAVTFEHGVMPNDDGLKPFGKCVEAIAQGDSVLDLINRADTRQAATLHMTNLSKMSSMLSTPRSATNRSKAFWFHGDTGCGKTRTAYEFGKAYCGMAKVCMTGSDSDEGKG